MIDEFLYRRPIPAEGRGGTYHVTLVIDGKLVGPMTPAQAEARGFALPAILSEINTAATSDARSLREQVDLAAVAVDKAREEKQAVIQLAAAQIAERDNEITALRAQLAEAQKGEAVAVAGTGVVKEPSNPLLNRLTFGLAGK